MNRDKPGWPIEEPPHRVDATQETDEMSTPYEMPSRLTSRIESSNVGSHIFNRRTDRMEA